MKYFKQSLLFLLTFLFLFFLINGIAEGFANILTFPLLALTTFLGYYVYKQIQFDTEEHLQKRLTYAIEDKAAETWIQQEFAPQMLSFITSRQWLLIIYAFLFLGSIGFIWSYLINGFWQAVQDVSYALILFWIFVLYTLFFPVLSGHLRKLFPKKVTTWMHNEWIHGYLFLLPISYILYLLFPFETLQSAFLTKLFSFPSFFFIYTAFFVSLYALVSLNHAIHQEDDKKLREHISEELKKE